jgi:hypothetical protein
MIPSWVVKDTPWLRALLRAERQALEDVARAKATEVAFYKYTDDLDGADFFDRLEDAAHEAGFVTSRVPVYRERAFDELAVLVRAVGRGLRAAGMKRGERGLASLLEISAERRGLAKALDQGPVGSEIFELARAYVRAVEQPAREANRIAAWLSGSREQEERAHLPPLTRRTAKRTLGDLTRLVRVLGFKGSVLLFEGADVISKLPDARREQSYIVLRELIDNADGGRGMIATRIVVGGSRSLFEGPRSLRELEPLAMRVLEPIDLDAPEALPHRPLHDTAEPKGWMRSHLPSVRKPPENEAPAIRAIIRASHGVPAPEADVSTTVATERIDRHIDKLLELSSMQGSVFAMVSGAYGAGKTHLLLHLTARALRDRRPVFRLSLERLDADLGNPQRHLHRLLDQSLLPLEGRPSALDLLLRWTASEKETATLLEKLTDIAEDKDTDAADAAKRALRVADKSRRKAAALRAHLSAHELIDKPAGPSYRQDAYGRLLLWLELFARTAKMKGPVLLIDEAENLYRLGMREGERRTALRSLSFYCGGVLPGACVVLAITPDALESLRKDARELLGEVNEQATLLVWEDASMFRRRLKLSPVLEVPPLDRKELLLLASKLRRVHEQVRGKVDDAEFRRFAQDMAERAGGPRVFIRAVVNRLERDWWLGG